MAVSCSPSKHFASPICWETIKRLQENRDINTFKFEETFMKATG